MNGEECSGETINSKNLFIISRCELLFKVMVYADFHEGCICSWHLPFLLHWLLVMSLVLFNSHSPSHDSPASAHLSASLRSVLELRGGLGSRPHGLLTGSGCLGISMCVSGPACMNAHL